MSTWRIRQSQLSQSGRSVAERRLVSLHTRACRDKLALFRIFGRNGKTVALRVRRQLRLSATLAVLGVGRLFTR